MILLRIEHPVPDFDAWKHAFDRDPAGRARSGVRRYRVYRSLDDPRIVTVDLEFDDRAAAEAFRLVLRALWGQVEGTLMTAARDQLFEEVESRAT